MGMGHLTVVGSAPLLGSRQGAAGERPGPDVDWQELPEPVAVSSALVGPWSWWEGGGGDSRG